MLEKIVKHQSNLKLIFPISIILFIASLFILSRSLDFFFFQDDFFHLSISNAQNLNDFINFLKFRNDIIGYRPISIQFYFLSLHSLFNLNPFFYRFINLLLLILCYFLIIFTVFEITSKKSIALMTGSIWIASSIHFMTTTWISASYNIVGTFFWLLTTSFFLLFVKSKKIYFYILSILANFLAYGSFELAIAWLPVWFFYYFAVLKTPLYKSLKLFSPFILISVSYVLLRIVFKDNPNLNDYELHISLDSLKAFFWYILWALNIPEEFKYQVIDKFILINPTYYSYFSKTVNATYSRAFLIILLGVLLPASIIVKFKRGSNPKLIYFGILWFIVSIFPLLLIPNHAFIMYLTLASIGIYFLIAYILVTSQQPIIIYIFISVWLYSSIATSLFYRKTSYMIEAQSVARRFYENITSIYPEIKPESIILYPLENPAHVQALSNQNAIKAIYDDQSLSIYYNDENFRKSAKRGEAVYFYKE